MCGVAEAASDEMLEGVETAVAAIRVNRRKVRMMVSSLCVHHDLGSQGVSVTSIRNRVEATSLLPGRAPAVLALEPLRPAQAQPLPAAML